VFGVVLACGLALAPTAAAQDAAFQAFFFASCDNPSGGLATLCGQTPGGAGDLSGDSESSLNPNQIVAAQEGTLNSARDRSQRIEDRLDERRAEEQSESRIKTFGGVLAGQGVWFDRDATGRERGFDGTSAGLQIGADAEILDGAILGLHFSWMRSNADFDKDDPGVNFTPFNKEGSRDSDSYVFTLYGSYSVTDNLYVDAHVGGGYVDYELRRDVVFQETTRTVPQTDIRTRSKTDGHVITAGGRLGWEQAFGAASISPYGRIQFTRSKIDGDTESGGDGLAMRYGSDSRTSLTTALGASATYAISTDFGVVVPQIRMEWEHEFERSAETLESRYPLDLDGNVFRTRGDSPDRDYVNIGGGVVAVLPGGWMPYVDYQALLFYDDWTRHQLTGGIRKEF
jgi:outer membrane autotransporter protein